jgi:hypothetical protein
MQKNVIMAVLLLALAAGLLFSAEQQQEQKGQISKGRPYNVYPAASKMKIDGILDEEAWSRAEVIKLPFEWLPGDNIPAPVDTDFLVTFDESYLYMAFRCNDPEPKKIRAHIMDRDNTDTLIQDDHISVMIDAFNDERRGFQFRVNPLGVQADANFSELEGYEDFSWDAIWDSAGKITEWGYAIEIAIPFNQLRFQRSSSVQTWGFSAERSYPRSVRHRMTSHVRSRNVACILCQFNKLTGFQNISPGRNLEFDPTLTANRTDAIPPQASPTDDLKNGKIKSEPGITVKWGITPNMILNATANPDFSQVEADVAQLDVNTRFALYYPEKRPFFLEGADFFLTPIQSVFTRTVADPAWGAKFTSKMGRSALGFFTNQDEINNLIFPSNQGSMSASLDKRVYGGVFRYRYDLGQASTVGVLYTGRAGEGYSNHVGGFDAFLRLDRVNNIRVQYLRSETDYPNDLAAAYGQKTGTFGGNSVYAEFLHMSRNWLIDALYQDLGRGFRADYGFIPRVDLRQAQGTVQRIIWGKQGGWFDRISVGVQAIGGWNYDGLLTDQAFVLGLIYQGPLQTQGQLMGIKTKEYYDGVTYSQTRANFFFAMKPAGGISFGLNGLAGDFIDYANSRLASMLSLGPNLELGLGHHLNLNFSHNLERLSLKGNKIYTANLSQARFIYNFNVRTFVRAILQYRDVDRDPGMYVFPVPARMKTLFTQFLFSYKINPQTVLFLGYSDNSLGLQGMDITRQNRTFFLKIGYSLGM